MPVGTVGRIHKTPGELGVRDETLPLTCVACGKTASYDVGTIMMHPRVVRGIDPRSAEACFASLRKSNFKEDVYFSGYVECEFCGSGDDWDFPHEAKDKLAQLVLEDIFSKGQGAIVFGTPVLYDGTLSKNAFFAVQYLKKQIAADPQNGFLWSRLGNAYVSGNRTDLSGSAFEKSAELDPDDPETHHSLGLYWRNLGEDAKAASCFHMLMRKCHTGKWRRRDLREEIMVSALDDLWQIQARTRGAIQVFPPAVDDEGFAEAERLQPFAMAYPDLSSPYARQQLARALIAGVPQPLRRQHSNWQKAVAPALVPREQSPKTKAQDRRTRPCPCGSGKKYGKCCGKR